MKGFFLIMGNSRHFHGYNDFLCLRFGTLVESDFVDQQGKIYRKIKRRKNFFGIREV